MKAAAQQLYFDERHCRYQEDRRLIDDGYQQERRHKKPKRPYIYVKHGGEKGVLLMTDLDEKDLSKLIKSAAKEAVKEARQEDDDLGPHEHYLHHQWVKDRIKKGESLIEIAKRAAVQWGTIAAIVTFGMGILEVIKKNLGG